MKKKSLIKNRAAAKKAAIAKRGSTKGLTGKKGGFQGGAGGFQGGTGGFQGGTGGLE